MVLVWNSRRFGIGKMMVEPIVGKSIIVTGGLSGIGLSLTKYFASSPLFPSPDITILDLSISLADPVLLSLRAAYPDASFSYRKCDISDWEDQADVFLEVYRERGRVDVVCVNAGLSAGTGFEEIVGREEEEEPERPGLRGLDVGLVGSLYTIKLAVHYMRKSAKERRERKGAENGIILCTASNAGLYPFPVAPTYSIAKHGLVGGVRSLAKPLAQDGIRINAICPNCIATSKEEESLMENMRLTPMSTLIEGVKELVSNQSLTGVVAEISGEKYTFREPPEYVDAMTKENFDTFWKLGCA